MQRNPAPPPVTSAYERMLDEIRNEALTRRPPVRPAPGASKEVMDEYMQEFENYRSNMEAEMLQTRTLEDSRNEKRQAEKLLFERGLIGDQFQSSILLRDCKPVREFIDYLDGCTNALKDSTTITVILQRPSLSLPFGFHVSASRPWNDFVTISQVPNELPQGVTVKTSLESSSSSSSSSLSSFSADSSTKVDSFALLMNGRKRSREETMTPLSQVGTNPLATIRKNGLETSSASSSIPLSSSTTSKQMSSFPYQPLFSFKQGDQIIGVEDSLLSDKAFPDNNGFRTFLELQRKTPSDEGSSSSFSSSSSSSSSSSEPFVFTSHAFEWCCKELKTKLSVQLKIRRLSEEGALFSVQMESGIPAWIFDTPIKSLRTAFVSLLNAEKHLLKFKDHGKQYAKNFLVQQVEEVINGFAGDVFTGQYKGDSIIHPLVDKIQTKATWLTSELSKISKTSSGTIVPLPTLLTQSYVRPHEENEEEDDVVFLEVRKPIDTTKSSLVTIL